MFDRRMSSSEVNRRINAIVAPLATHLQMLIQSVKDFSEGCSSRSTEKNAASERSRSSTSKLSRKLCIIRILLVFVIVMYVQWITISLKKPCYSGFRSGARTACLQIYTNLSNKFTEFLNFIVT